MFSRRYAHRLMRLRFRPRRAQTRRTLGRYKEICLTVILALSLAVAVIVAIEMRIRPLAEEIAKSQVQNTMTALVEKTVMDELGRRELGYKDFVTIQRDESGAITALTTDMAEMNRLRADLMSQVLKALETVDVSAIDIPLGSLLDVDFLWAKGPSFRLYAMSVGTVSAEYESEFTSAGINQTLHRIWMEVSIPIRLMLPGGSLDTAADTRLCVAETVIVGTVPSAYFSGNIVF